MATTMPSSVDPLSGLPIDIPDDRDQLVVHAQYHNLVHGALRATESIVVDMQYNVKGKDYGAVGNGTTDDTTAIQAAITAAQAVSPYGGIVYLPPGTYKTTAQLNATNHVTIAGPGYIKSTKLDAHVLYIHDCANVVVRDVTIGHDTPLVSSTYHALYCKNVNNLEISHVTVPDSIASGILVENPDYCSIHDCVVSGTLRDGIHIDGPIKDISIYANHIHDTGDDAISAQGYTGDSVDSYHCRIFGNSIYNGSGRGISLMGVNQSSIVGNTIQQTKYAGIYLKSDKVARAC